MGIERATTKSEKANESKHIWIHALSIESDMRMHIQKNLKKISIHALNTESDFGFVISR